MGIIEINDLSKRYLRAKPDSSLSTFGEALASTLKNPLGIFRRPASHPVDAGFFWALKDINLRVHAGDVIGIIGRNGAGKSTLLKVLSRITEPTTGRVVLRGRMASLLEVGTGFHPELTGRENIFLNGAILGMKKHEIRAQFDEIVAFSEVEEFLDTPVKRYSSGMYVRLAFAVAAHLNPEILVVDEVLAVGDFAFQRKCLGKMSEVSRNGRTILFVSHNMAAVENLCTRGVLLEGGRIVFDGSSGGAIREYLHTQGSGGESKRVTDLAAVPRGVKYHPHMTALEVFTDSGVPIVQTGAPAVLRISFRMDDPGMVGAGIAVDSIYGQRIFLAHTLYSPGRLEVVREGEYVLTCRIPSLTLCPGEYKLTLSLSRAESEVDRLEDAYRLTVVGSDFYGTGKLPPNGIVVMPHGWSLESVEHNNLTSDPLSLVK